VKAGHHATIIGRQFQLLLRLPANEIVHDGNQAVELFGSFSQRRFCPAVRRARLSQIVRNEDLGPEKAAVFFLVIEKHFFLIVQPGFVPGSRPCELRAWPADPQAC
jgi:hypothetical protein